MKEKRDSPLFITQEEGMQVKHQRRKSAEHKHGFVLAREQYKKHNHFHPSQERPPEKEKRRVVIKVSGDNASLVFAAADKTNKNIKSNSIQSIDVTGSQAPHMATVNHNYCFFFLRASHDVM